ncbi:MAG TPA: ATP-binding protein, partial [Candidatus Ozemobacteraceae bacterium]|nr:ATP-binding protein [Candidatus Ozemobacteraceae bacterium]
AKVVRDYDTALSVVADDSRLGQVFLNLIVNAAQAIPEGDVDHNEIRISARLLDGNIVVEVSDTGQGISTSLLEKLFQPFFTTKEQGKGTGLGLATVFGIVSQNQGQIKVSSTPGRGTTFSLYFPRSTASLPAATPTPTAETRPVSTATRSLTILLVEDEPSLLEISQLMLERCGHTVLTAHSPLTALKIEQEHSGALDLLMTDIMLPEMNGRELRDRLIARRPSLQTLFISGYTADVIARQGLIESGVHFLQKPFNRQKLLDKLAEILPLIPEAKLTPTS